MDAITDLAEQLAQSLRRSVAVDDPDLRLIGSSTHFGDADPLRLTALANRRIEGAVRDATFAAGFPGWREPRRGRALGFEGHDHDRMAFPLRSRHGLLAVMWVILTDEADLSDDEMTQCLTVAREMERVLSRQVQAEMEADLEGESLLFTLLSDSSTDREAAAHDLLDLGLFHHSTDVTALVIVLDELPYRHAVEHTAVLRRALKQATQAQSDRSCAFAVTESTAFLLVGSRGHTARSAYTRIAERVIDEVSRLEPDLADHCRCGIGSAVPLVETTLSYDHGTVAASIAGDRRAAVVFWQDHPLEALLASVIRPEVTPAGIPAVLTDLVESQPVETLRTVQCFLDQAGNVARTSELLHLHRTTVYYRLRQFEKETGLSLDDGQHRLLLQLWLRIRAR